MKILAVCCLIFLGPAQPGPPESADQPKLSTVLPAADSARHWPRFRGPNGQGNATTRGLPTTWSATENIIWRRPLAGSGNSSPILWGQRLFVTTSENAGKTRSLICLAADTGELVWTQAVAESHVESKTHRKNGFASATPVTDGERVIGVFGSAGLVAFDFEGQELWRHPLPQFDTIFGTASSPLLYQDAVFFIQDQTEGESFMLALDKRSGKLLWQHARPKGTGWSTAVMLRAGDHDQLLFQGQGIIQGYDPATGTELWSVGGARGETAPTLVIGDRLLYSASGPKGPLLGLLPGAASGRRKAQLAWQFAQGGAHVPSPLWHANRLFSINDSGVLTCLAADSGKRIFQGRLKGNFTASPIECAGLLYFPNEDGTTFVVRAADKLEIVAENDLGSPILASPAAVSGRLYIRAQDGVICIGQRPPPPAP